MNHEAALRLHQWLVSEHGKDEGLLGPDPGIRWNYRIGRFVKSSLRALPWRDSMYYLQGQAYWILANWRLWDLEGDDRYREIAIRASHGAIGRQRSDGAWEYPNPEWRGRVATAEGTWASIGLLESYRQTGDTSFLDPVKAWHAFLCDVVGFNERDGILAVNYFVQSDAIVPNNSVTVLRFLAELADVTGDDTYFSDKSDGLLRLIRACQAETGEIPYRFEPDDEGFEHFQCFQYNAFELINLLRVSALRDDVGLDAVIESQAKFLASGVADDGHLHYDCSRGRRRTVYHTAAAAAALLTAERSGVEGVGDAGRRALGYVLAMQNPAGAFPYSFKDYRLISDRRSYPRYQSMILLHLLSDPVLASLDEAKRMTSVLVVTVALPTAGDPNTMAPLARQVASLRDAGLTVDLLEIGRDSKLNYLRAIRKVQKVAPQYDVIHGHYGYCGWVARAQRSTPVVVSFMGDDLLGTPNEDGSIRPISGLVARVNRWFAGWVTAVIVKSDEMAGKLRRPAHVIPNGVDVATFRPVPQEEATEQLGWVEDELRVLFPGNPHNPRKQYGLASAAVREAERRLGRPISLVVLHEVAPDLVPQYMNACHAMILTSHIEGSPNVVKEAMACNLPVVSVAVGDTPQLLDGVDNSHLCRRDEGDLAERLVEVLTTRERSSGRDVLLARGLDAESVAARIVAVYNDVRQRTTP